MRTNESWATRLYRGEKSFPIVQQAQVVVRRVGGRHG